MNNLTKLQLGNIEIESEHFTSGLADQLEHRGGGGASTNYEKDNPLDNYEHILPTEFSGLSEQKQEELEDAMGATLETARVSLQELCENSLRDFVEEGKFKPEKMRISLSGLRNFHGARDIAENCGWEYAAAVQDLNLLDSNPTLTTAYSLMKKESSKFSTLLAPHVNGLLQSHTAFGRDFADKTYLQNLAETITYTYLNTMFEHPFERDYNDVMGFEMLEYGRVIKMIEEDSNLDPDNKLRVKVILNEFINFFNGNSTQIYLNNLPTNPLRPQEIAYAQGYYVAKRVIYYPPKEKHSLRFINPLRLINPYMFST